MSDTREPAQRPARGYSWPPFEEGNAAAVKHGAYAVLQLTPRAGEIAEWIRASGEHLTPADAPAVQTLALMLAQLERWGGVLHEIDEATVRGDDLDGYLGLLERRASLSKDARGWANAARNLMNDLALTPSGRAALDAAKQLTGMIPAHQAQELLSAFFLIAQELIEHSRRQEFLARVDKEIARRYGLSELPPVIDVDAAKP